MLFKEIIGQEKVKQKLIQSANAGRVAHAQLFFGPQGAGALPLALAYAQYLVCQQRTPDDSCGVCQNCRKIAKLAHPDLHFSFPINSTQKNNKAIDKLTCDDFIDNWREMIREQPYFDDSMWYRYVGIENKQGIIGKGEGDNIIRKFNLKPFEADYKMLILWLPENLNTKAANSLLKLVEEPPPQTLFLLVSANPNEIMATIYSRVQPIRLQALEAPQIEQALLQIDGMSQSQAEFIARISNGSYTEALDLLKSADIYSFFLEKFIGMMRLAWMKNMQEINLWVDEMARLGREQLSHYFKYTLHMLRDNFMLYLKDDEFAFLSEDERKFSEKFHLYINERTIMPLNRELNKAANDIAANANGKIVLLDLVLKLSQLIKL